MSQTLFAIIKNFVYKEEEIQEISLNSSDKKIQWIFDFKGQSVSKVFLEEYAKEFWGIFEGRYKDGKHFQIGGMETGALGIIAGLALNSPEHVPPVTTFYIRKSRKKSDLANRIEGVLLKDTPVILVDDMMNRGGSFRKQITLLEEEGYKVSDVFTCLRFRDMSAYQDIIDKGITVHSIFELNDFSNVLPVKNLSSPTRSQLLPHYSVDYKAQLTKKPNLYIVVPKAAPVISEGYIYMGVDDGSFFCLDKKDGKVIWSYKVFFGAQGKRIFSSPQVFKDKVIFGAYDGNVYCLNKYSGKVEWIFSDADWVGSSPCVDEENGIVFIGLEFSFINKKGGVAALSISTGEVIWKNYEMEGLTHATPSFSKKYSVVVCGCNDSKVYTFNAKTGKVIWAFQTEGELKYGAVFDEKRGLVCIASLDGGVYVIHIKTGKLYHRFEAYFGFYSTPVLKDDLLVIGSLDKRVYCFNLETKKTQWTFNTSGRIFASPALFDGHIFIGSNDGRLYEIEFLTGKLITHIQLTERIVNKVQIEKDENNTLCIYVPTHVGELYKLVHV